MSKEQDSSLESEDVNETDDSAEENEEVVEEEENSEEDAEEIVEEEEEEIEPKSTRTSNRIRELIAERNAFRELALERKESSRPSLPEKEEDLPVIEDPTLEAAVEARVNRRTKHLENYIGQTLEQPDEVKASNVIPNYDKIADKIERYRQSAYRSGQFLKRVQAYKLMVADGLLKEPDKVTKKTVVRKSKPKAGIVKKSAEATSRGKATSKNFAELSFEEKEKKLGDVVF